MRIDLGFSLMGEAGGGTQRYVHITRRDVVKRITDHPAIDPWTKDFLVKRVAQYPDDALIYFVTNINEIVINALNTRTKKLKEQNVKEEIGSRETPADLELCGETSFGGVSEIKGAAKQEESRESLFSRPAR